VTPNGDSASSTAATIAPAAGTQPDSPTPLTPSGLSGDGNESDFVFGRDKGRDVSRELIGAKLQRQALGGEQRRQIGKAEYGMHARQPARHRRINAANAGMGVRTAHERRFEHAGKFQVVDKTALTTQKRPVFEPQHVLADGLIGFHVFGRLRI
jgi:hypothetical protein